MTDKKAENKLAKEYDQINSDTKTLQEQENEIVQNYTMKEGDYKILVTIYEANDLLPRPADYFFKNVEKSACSAFVEVEINGQKEKTPVREETNNPIWQDSFSFRFENMSVQELDRSKITFNVYDKNHFIIADTHLGQFELDWTNVYFRRFHEIYRGWLTLSDPKEEIQGPVGYLLVSISVLGPDDKIMVHDSAFIKDPLTTIEDTITNTKVPLIDYSLNIEVYRAENLIPLDLASRSVDAYVVAKFSGNKVNSEIISSLNPQWNQALKIGTGVPNKTKYVILEVWNRNRLTGHDLIGAIKIPFIDIYEDKYITPQWGHLYGPPMCAVDEAPINYATKMQVYGQEIGSHYRGRLLFKVVGKKYVHSTNGTNKLQFKFPVKPTPVVPLKTYTLRVQLLQGFQLPQRPEAVIHIGIGQYIIKSRTWIVKNRVCEFNTVLQDKKVQFAQDIEQVPDIILYFCDGKEENNRMSFKRIKASDVATSSRHKNHRIYQLQGDKSLNMLKGNQIGGYITCKINLFTNAVPLYKSIENAFKEKFNYLLVFYLYKGENFPPANVEGDCDPFIRFNCEGVSKESKPIEGSFNPMWQEIIQMPVAIQDVFDNELTKGVVCEAFDHEQSGKHQYIGSFLIELNNTLLSQVQADSELFKDHKDKIKILYQKPKWYYIKNPHVQIGNNIFGKVLLSIALFKEQDYSKKKIPKHLLSQTENKKLIPTEDKLVQIYLIGLRDIRDTSKRIISQGKAKVIMRMDKQQKPFESKDVAVKKSACEINSLIECKLKIPKNKKLVPYIDFRVQHNKSFYGFNSISLYKLLPKLALKEGLAVKQEKQDSQETILDVEGLEKQLQLLKEKRKQDQINRKLGLNSDKPLQIENLKPPLELGYVPKEGDQHLQQNKAQLENLIQMVKANFEESPEFQYVRTLKEKYGNKQQKKQDNNLSPQPVNNTPEEPKKNAQRSTLMVPKEHSEYDRASVGYDQASKTKNDGKSQQKLEKKHQTIFDKMKQDQLNKKKLEFEKRNNQKQEQSMIKSVRQQKELQISKNKDLTHIEEQQQPLQQHLSQRSERESKKDEKQLKSRQQTKKLLDQNNNDKFAQKNYKDMENRYSANPNGKSRDEKKSERSLNKMEPQGIKNQNIHIDIQTDQQFSEMSIEERVINYKDVERVMKQQEKDEKQAKERDDEYKFANAVKLTLFGWNRKKKKKDIQTYEDYDTEQGEDLNIIPEWYKGRKILTSDFQDLNFKATKIQTIPLYGGQKIENTIFQAKKKESAGHIKMIIMAQSSQVAKEKEEYYNKLLKPKEYYARIYILKGKSLISNYDAKPSTYLRFTYGEEVVSMKDRTYKQNENNPEYYICYELPLNLPGPASIKVQVIQTHDILGKFKEKVLGYTDIDLEQRYFMRKWHLYEKKPIQLRNLYSEYGMGSQGRIQTFIQLVEKKKWLSTPAHPIAPPPFDKYELRVIVWKTDDCVYKNVEMESNDIYVRAFVGTCEPQETDTHWACRSVGNFNYRMKFPICYPQKPQDMYSDIFTVQIWDRDLVGYNNLIGQKRINLHKIHRIIEKAVKRRKPVRGKMKIKEKSFAITDRFWFDVFNNKEKDEFGIPQTQGRVQLSFELVPFEQAEQQLKNGYGRSEPNVYPTLPDPEGRLQFDFFSPLSFIKQIIGPKLYARWCCRILCCLLIGLLVLFGFIFLPTLLAVKI